jgi:hypothetical protein
MLIEDALSRDVGAQSAPLCSGRGVLPLGSDFLATVYVLLAYLTAQPNRDLYHSVRLGDDPRHWLGTFLFQMAARSSLRTVYARKVVQGPLWVISRHFAMRERCLLYPQ